MSVGVWRIVRQLNAQLDGAERALAKFGAPTAESQEGISEAAAIEIATKARGPLPEDLPEEWAKARRVTEVAPPGLYRTWPDEPTWYVWFLPKFFGLGSSEVVAVSKRAGRVLGSGSAGDEG